MLPRGIRDWFQESSPQGSNCIGAAEVKRGGWAAVSPGQGQGLPMAVWGGLQLCRAQPRVGGKALGRRPPPRKLSPLVFQMPALQ